MKRVVIFTKEDQVNRGSKDRNIENGTVFKRFTVFISSMNLNENLRDVEDLVFSLFIKKERRF